MGSFWKLTTLLSLLFIGFFSAKAQISVIVKEVPYNTPKNADIYIVGSFNDWNPSDSIYRLTRQSDGSYYIRMPFRADFDFKFTRGSWESVEGSFSGEARDDRIFRMEFSESDTLYESIVSWEDLPTQTRGTFDTIVFVIDKIPSKTPKDASIYVVGNFNDWHPGSPKYRAERLKDGTYQIKIPVWFDTLEYKFTRGDWESVEGRNNGRAIRNRMLVYNPNEKEINITINSWEDLYGGLTPYAYILIFAAMQGFLLILAIYRLQDKNKAANRLLYLLIGLISFALLARVSTIPREIFQSYPKLILLPDLIVYFVYGPIFLFYIQKLLTIPLKSLKSRWIHFVPFVLHALSYAPFLLMPEDTFIDKVLNEDVHFTFALSGGLAFLFNAYYWWKCLKVVRNYQTTTSQNISFDGDVQYLNTIIAIKGLVLGIWFFTYAVSIVAYFLNTDAISITETSTDIVWLVFSSVTYCLGYFAITQPEIFKHHEISEEEEQKIEIEVKNQLPPEEIAPLKEKITHLMETEKPYLNSKLTLAGLAKKIDLSHHLLSRVINEGFDKNFYDFVNSYRVEAFKTQIEKNEHENKTLLALAYDVGFNSKSSFNRSFNKLVGMSPSKYLKVAETGEKLPSLIG